ncbi:MAG: AsmA family protein [Proteobacteria bacterium]|nr:AsmA family protein [Pseudomonadota bacterium]
MNKFFKYILASLAGAAILFVLLIVVASLVINPNDYKPQIIQLVKEKKQRTLTLEGDIKLAFFPKLGLDLGRASLSEFRGKKEFASVESARLFLSWWPLLRKKLVVDQVRIEGVNAHLVRFKDNTTNFDDLLKKEEEQDNKQISFDIESVAIEKCALSFRDEMAKRQFAVSDLSIKTGRLVNGKSSDAVADFTLKGDNPQINAQIHMTTGLAFDTEAKRYGVKGLNLEITGEAAGLSKLNASLKGDIELDKTADTLLTENLAGSMTGRKDTNDVNITLTAPRLQWVAGKMATDKIDLTAKMVKDTDDGGEINLTASIPSLSGDRQSFKAGMLSVEFNTKGPGGAYKGKLSSPLSGNFNEKQFALSKLKGNLEARDTKTAQEDFKLDVDGSAQLDLMLENATVNLTSHLDESTIKLKGGITPFTKPHIALDLNIDTIDADRYLPPRKQKKSSQPEKPLDFSILKTLKANGSVRVGSLKMYNIRTSNVRLDFKAGGGQLDVRPLSAELYQGKMTGNLSLYADGPKIVAHQNISGVHIGPLLKDALNKDILEGKGSLNFNIQAEGATVGAMKKSLQGKGNLNLRDGAVKGFNITAKLREAKAMLGTLTGEKVQDVDMREKTDFSELTAGFDIKQGVAHNKDLAAKSPLLRVSGNGDIDIGEDKVDYRIRATVVASLEGQGGRELLALKGVTVPVRVVGPMAATKVSLDFNALVGGAIQQEIKTRVTDPLKEGLKGLFR